MERLKGMTIELDLDTLKVNRGLTGLKDRLRTVNQEMRHNMSSFDRSDRSIKKYETRLNGLNKKLEVQRKATQAAKERMEEMIKEHGKGSAKAEQATREYHRQAASLNNLERYVQKVTDEMRAFERQQAIQSTALYRGGDALIDFGNKLDSISSKTRDVGQSLTRYVTTPIAGLVATVGGMGFKRAMDIEQVDFMLQNITGSEKEAETITKRVSDLVTDTSFGLAEVGSQAAKLLSSNAKEDMAFLFTETAMELSAMAGDDNLLPQLTDVYQKALLSGKIDGTMINQFANANIDILSVLGNKWNKSKDEVREIIQSGNVDIQEVLADLSNGVLKGTKGLHGDTVAAAGMIEKSGETLRGKIKNFFAAVSQRGEELITTTGLFDGVKDALDELRNMLKSGELDAILLPTFEGIANALEALVDISRKVFKWFSNLSDTTKRWIGNFIGFAAILGPILTGLGIFGGIISKITIGLGNFMKFLSPITAPLKEIGKASGSSSKNVGILSRVFAGLSNPVGIAITILTVLGTIFVALYKRSDKFREGIQSLGKGIKNVFKGIADFLKPIFDVLIERAIIIWEGIKDITNQILQYFQPLFERISNFFNDMKEKLTDFFDGEGDKIREALTNIQEFIVNFIEVINEKTQMGFEFIKGIIDFVMPIIVWIIEHAWSHIEIIFSSSLDIIMVLIDMFSNIFTGNWSGVWENVKEIFSIAIDMVIELMKNSFIGKMIISIVEFSINFVKKIVDMWNSTKERFVEKSKEIYSSFKESFVGRIIIRLVEFSSDFRQNILNMWIKVKEYFSTKINEIWNNLKNSFIGRIITNIIKFVSNFKSNISDMWEKIKSKFKEKIDEVWNNLKNSFIGRIISNIITFASNFRKNISDMWSNIKKNFSEKIKEIRTSIKNSFVGKMLKSIRNLKNDFIDLAKEMWDGVKKRFDDMVDGAKALPGRLGRGIKNAKDKAIDGVKDLGNSMVSKLGGVVNGMIDGINNVTGKLGIKKKISRWEVPQFAKGTDGHKGGPMIVGEEGPELITLPDGNSFLSPDGDTLLPDMPKGTKVLPNPLTEKILNAEIPQFAKGTGWSAKLKQKISSGLKNTKDWMGNIWDYAKSPGKLINKIVENLGLKITGLKGGASNIAKGSFNYVKNRGKDYLKNMFKKAEEEGGNFKGVASPGQVKRWIARAISITGVPHSWSKPLQTIAMKESGGNPRAINLWDINAKRGIPSKGLMQTIDPTFSAFKRSGMDNIWNPIHNAVAAINYIKSRYGNVFNTPGIRSMSRGGAYRGYKRGGLVLNKQLAWLAEDGYPEMVIPLDPKRRTDAMKLLALTGKMLGADKGRGKSPSSIPSISKGEGNKEEEKLTKEMLAVLLEQNELLRKLLEKETDIHITDKAIGKASMRYSSKRSIAEGYL